MTASDDVTTLSQRLALEGLTAVLGAAAVRPLRGDSPLPLTDADLVALADAVERAAARAGASCLLDDADFALADGSSTRTASMLAAAIDARLGQGAR